MRGIVTASAGQGPYRNAYDSKRRGSRFHTPDLLGRRCLWPPEGGANRAWVVRAELAVLPPRLVSCVAKGRCDACKPPEDGLSQTCVVQIVSETNRWRAGVEPLPSRGRRNVCGAGQRSRPPREVSPQALDLVTERLPAPIGTDVALPPSTVHVWNSDERSRPTGGWTRCEASLPRRLARGHA